MVAADPVLTWRKSTRSGEAMHCVEVAHAGDAIAMRDSKHPDGPRLVFSAEGWRAFLAAVRVGDFDLQ
jgi:hypothetical protein